MRSVWSVDRGGYFLGDQNSRTEQLEQLEEDNPGWRIVEANDYQLFLDLDLDEDDDPDTVKEVITKLAAGIFGDRATPPKFFRSKSGRNLHAVIRMQDPRPLLERVALQLALGSDPVRERISVQRHVMGIRPAVVLLLKNGWAGKDG